MKELLACIVLAALSLGCSADADQPARDPAPDCPHTAKPFGGGPSAFRFAIMADRTGNARPGVFEEAVEKLTSCSPIS